MKPLLAVRNFVLLAHRQGRFDGRYQGQNKHWPAYVGGGMNVKDGNLPARPCFG